MQCWNLILYEAYGWNLRGGGFLKLLFLPFSLSLKFEKNSHEFWFLFILTAITLKKNLYIVDEENIVVFFFKI